jgi:ubiquinone/menaquinone biosynthesis C-methylase UbiE
MRPADGAADSESSVPHLKFDLAKLGRLNDPGRFDTIKPDVMQRALHLDNPAVIVEVGAGTGLFSAKFAQLYPDAVVYAADIEPRMVGWMQQNRPEVGQGRVVPVLAAETRVPLGDAVADAVLMINLHHELADKPGSYSEAKRLLKRGGRLMAVDWAPRETPKGPPLAVREPAEAVVALLGDLGFETPEAHEGLVWHWLVTARKT